MKPTGHRSHVSGMKRFIRVYRTKQEFNDLVRYMQDHCVGDHMNAHLHGDGSIGYGEPCTYKKKQGVKKNA